MALHASSPVLSELPLHCFQCAWMYVLLGRFVRKKRSMVIIEFFHRSDGSQHHAALR